MKAPPSRSRRQRFLGGAAPLALIAIVAFIWGSIWGAGAGAPIAERFADAWAAGDFEAMHTELSTEARQGYPVASFTTAYEEAELAATTQAVAQAGDVVSEDDVQIVPIEVTTSAFGVLGGQLALPLGDDGIAWEPHLVFPGLEPGETLARDARLAERAPILARDGTALAEGPAEARAHPLGDAVMTVTGTMGPAETRSAAELAAAGLPSDVPVGISGLELAFDSRLAGDPGGNLVAIAPGQDPAAGRVLASREPEAAEPLRTTIDADLQLAATTALAGLFGGVTVLDARDGSVLAMAGGAAMAPQPPGSVFKVITAAAALDQGIAEPDSTYPVEISRITGGREIFNAGNAPCGGTLVESFARSCNTVFAPLGVELGEEELIEAAERFGFNRPPALYGDEATQAASPAESTLPEEFESDSELAVTAIGQGRMLATTLAMASMSQAIAADGMLSPTPIVAEAELQPEAGPWRVASEGAARDVRRMMLEVVRSGTGVMGQVPGIEVAGKTGTAELGPDPEAEQPQAAPGEPPPRPVMLLDAWFTAFAPAQRPRVAVSVLVVESGGDGGDIAAPIAAEVISEALGNTAGDT